MYYTYILQSLQDNKLYVGFTNDLKQRLQRHNAQNVRSTKARAPFRLIYYEASLSEQYAREREQYLKTGWGRNFIKKILSSLKS
jgi:putative endonuclease